METQVDSFAHSKNAARIAREEAELQKLLEEAGLSDGSVQQETAEDVTEEEPRSEESSEPEVRTESRTEQKEKPEVKAQEDDSELSPEEKTFKQRYSDIRKYMQEKDEEHKTELAKIKKQLDAATKNELVLPKTEEEIESWAKKYPDVAGIIEAIADRKANEKAANLDKRLKEIEELRATATREKAEADLLRMHPDFYDIRDDDAFHEWAEKQSKALQKALYDDPDNVEDVAWAIDMYKTAKGIKTQKPSSVDKSAATSVKSKRAAPNTNDSSQYLRESQVAKMSMKEYEKRAEEIFEAQRSGKFIYDLSRKQLTFL